MGGREEDDDWPRRSLPAKDRHGTDAWLGPVSLGLAVLSWPIPAGGVMIAVLALACAVWSMSTKTEYRLDWTAVAGAAVATLQLFLWLMLTVMTAAGH